LNSGTEGVEQGDYRSADGDPASGATNGRRWAAEDVFHCVPLPLRVLVRKTDVVEWNIRRSPMANRDAFAARCGQRGDIPAAV
jgi:hypothetical protein